MATRHTKRPAPPKDCPLEQYLHIISGAWVPKIIWYLRQGARRFGELERDLETVSAKVLTEKLRMLEGEGIVERTVLATSPPQVEYSLTARGRAFDPVFEAMEQVSLRLRRMRS